MISKPLFPTGKCSISDDWTYRDMQVIRMENDYLRIGILAGRGGDIFEFYYKPAAVELMLRLPKGIRNPQQDFSQMRDSSNQFEDYYYGGWQTILPGSPAFNYRGASLGQHGEVALIPWKHSILENGPEKVVVRLWTRPLRMPLLIEKTLTLTAGAASLSIDEKLTNESRTHVDLLWGHHIAFGLPFLKEGGTIDTNAKYMIAEPAMPDHRRFKPGIKTEWPSAQTVEGKPDNASIIPPESAAPYSDLAYLTGFGEEGYYTLKSRTDNLGFHIKWDPSVFKCLWYWQERYATLDAPWWGNAYAVGLELFTSRFRLDPQEAIRSGEWLKMEAGEELTTSLEASVVV